MTSPTTQDLVAIALAYDYEPIAVREQVAAWLREQGAFGRGAADELLRGIYCPHCSALRARRGRA